MFSRKLIACNIAVASSALCLVPAANADDFVLEEVLVTAQKRAESVQDVPIAISAIGEEMLVNTGIDDVTALIPMVPGLTGHTWGLTTNTWAIRGISTNDFSLGSEPSVGVFLDDGYIGRNVLATGAFFDTNRVEVVKGPQGTLFGRNAAAGAISIVSNKPDDENELDLGVSVGNEGHREYSAVANLAVSEDFALRAAYHGKRLEGVWKFVNQGNKEAISDSDNLRVMARWNIADNLEALLTLQKGEAETTMSQSVAMGVAIDPYEIDYDKVDVSLEPDVENETDGAGLRLTWDINDSLSLASITDFRGADYHSHTDPDGINDTLFGDSTLEFLNVNEVDTAYQEFRLNGGDDKLQWFTGVSYFEEDLKGRTRLRVLGLPGAGGSRPAFATDDYFVDGENTAIGAYADGTLALSDNVSVTAGARWSKDKKEWCTNTVSADIGFADALTDGKVCDELEWNEVTSRAVLEYTPAEDVMLYASVAEGYKGGGFNGSALDANSNDIAETVATFDPEYNLAYELGMKSTLLDGRMQFNAAAFFNDYEDLQVQAATLLGIVVDNAAAAETKGFELEMTYMPQENLTLMANYAYLDTEVTKGVDKGNELSDAPESTYSVSASYDMNFSAGTVSLFAIYNRTGAYFNDIANNSDAEVDSYGLLNSRITFTPTSERWDVSLAGDNLTDEAYEVSRTSAPFGPFFGPLATRGLPRMVRVEFNLHL